ncbi:DUF5810 domain-containing protein [Natrialbaceae archaeon A-arb3/5]
MGYSCPVCDAEQADAVHLANHLAVTASLGRTDHREWLADHAPDWVDCSPEELGAIVSEHASEIETPEFEGTSHGHEPGRPPGFEDELAAQTRRPGRGELTGDVAAVLEEAQEMTRQMQAPDESSGGTEPAADDGSSEGAEPSPADGEAQSNEQPNENA